MKVTTLRNAAGRFWPHFGADENVRRFRRWFWLPPRPHGETIADRTVSYLELLYDLVYVAVIGQATHHLAEHVTTRAVAEFSVIFALIWMAWINGSFYLEVHGREDGRTRSLVFLQMGLLALLAVYTATAAEEGGEGFALVYAAYQLVLTWLWYGVKRRDEQDHPEFVAVVGLYVTGMLAGLAVMLVSALLPQDPRLVVWAAFVLSWVAGLFLLAYLGNDLDRALVPTHSLVERFGLFTLIVLGEVVFGVVDGLSGAERDFVTVATGMLALVLGFGFWWVYFDLVGRRLPRSNGRAVVGWVMSHLPTMLSIAAAGAAMVSLIDHAHDSRTPEATAWLLGGSVAVGLVTQVFIERALVDSERLSAVYRPLAIAMVAGAVAAVGVALLQPAPWLLALLLALVLLFVWLFAVSRFLGINAWGEETG
jgi:low temperature requirement protein LtrA